MKKSSIEYPLLHHDNEFLIFDKPFALPLQTNRQEEMGAADWFSLHYNKEFQAISQLQKEASGCAVLAQKKLNLSIRYSYFFITKQLDQGTAAGKCHLLKKGTGKSALYQIDSELTSDELLKTLRRNQLSPIEAGGRLLFHCGAIELADKSFSAPLPDSFSFYLEQKSPLLLQAATAWERRNALPSLISNSWRLIHRGELSLPLSIEIYGQNLAITAFSDKSSKQIRAEISPLCSYLEQKVACKQVILRRHATNPHQKKLIHDLISWGEKESTTTAVEHDLQFAIDLNSNQHTGLFLDQRDSRQRIRRQAAGKRVANLFSFTCSFSASALQGGAEVVFSVDLAASALRRGKKNFAANGLDKEGRGKFIEADVCKWLSKQVAKQQENPEQFRYWDLIICDPPVFASAGKGQAFHVEKKWSEMAKQIYTILSPNGQALFANNHRGGNSHYYQKELEKYFRKVTPLQPPIDFPQQPGEAEHVRIYFCDR